MGKTRVQKGEGYWRLEQQGDFLAVVYLHDFYTYANNRDFEQGNYFLDESSASSARRRIFAVLAGADVIEMPSEEELIEKATDYAKTIYLEEALGGWEDGKGAFIDGATFIATKIVK